jgi:ribonuclease HI
LWYRVTASGDEVLVGGSAVDLSSLGFGGDASNQNTAEFIAALLGIRGLRKLRIEGPCPVLFRGDSKTALSWIHEMKFKSHLVGNAATFLVLQNIAIKIEVVRTEHLIADLNWRTDRLSRGKSLKELSARDPALENIPFINLDADEVLQLCNPHLLINNDNEFVTCWRRTKTAIDTNL